MSPNPLPDNSLEMKPSVSPSTAVPITGIPLKRILDDDIQFVSAKPVKKARLGSNQHVEQDPVLAKPPQPVPSDRPEPSKAKGDESHPTQAPPRIEKSQSTGHIKLPSEPRPPSPPTEPRGVTLPAMESFAFPQTFSSPLTDKCGGSPQVSPKHTPQTVQPAFLTSVTTQPCFEPIPFPDMYGPLSIPTMDNPFSFLGPLPPHIPMSPEAALNHRILSQPLQGLLDHQVGGGGPLSSDANLMTLAQVAESSTPPKPSLGTSERGTKGTAESASEPTMTGNNSLATGQKTTDGSKPQVPPIVPLNAFPVSGASRPPLPQVSQQIQSDQRPVMPLKKPCLICAQLRQRAGLNNAQGIFGLGPTSSLIPGQPMINSPFLHHPQGVTPSVPHTISSSQSLKHLNSAVDTNATAGSAPLLLPPHTSFPPSTSHSVSPTTTQPAKPPNPLSGPPSKPTPSSTPTPPPPNPSVTTAAAARLDTPTASDPTKRPPAPNLYVDIAETSLALFPYAEVARRHAVSRQRVVDVFAAVVQLPLLRCPVDKRRVGKLGVARMKEFNKTRKDLQGSKGDGEEASLYEIAEAMGPLDGPKGGKMSFSGPW